MPAQANVAGTVEVDKIWFQKARHYIVFKHVVAEFASVFVEEAG